MNEEYIIDGTNIICNAERENHLAPLLQLLLILKKKGHNFYCYFDADTRFKFDKEEDKQVYQNLINFGLNEHFIQVANLDADEPLLKQANAIGAKIISTDDFDSFYHLYPWLTEERRVLKVDVIAEKLIVEKLEINDSVNRSSVKIAEEIVNILEREASHLHGVIDKYKKERQFGFIKRNTANKNIFFSKQSVVDKNLDYTIKGNEVSFNIELSKSGSVYYFSAVDVRKQEAKTIEEVIETLTDENKILKTTKDTLQEQTAKAKAVLEKEIEVLKSENQTLFQKAQTYTGTDNQTIINLEKEKEQLKQEILTLNENNKELQETIKGKETEIERLNQQITLLLQEKAAYQADANEMAVIINAQEEKILNLDEDLRNTLQMFEFQDLEEAENLQFQQLKKDYQIVKTALNQKNSKILFLLNNINDLQKQISLNSEEVAKFGNVSTDFSTLLERIQELEKTNATLSEQVQSLSQNKPRKDYTRKSNSENQSDPEDGSAPSSSRPTVLDKKPKPRKIKEILLSELEDWWHNLSEDWQKAFNQAVLSRGEILQMPSEEQLRSIFERKKIDIVGSGILLYGLNQLSFKLKDLSGLKDLKDIVELNLSGHDFKDLNGIQQFQALETLNCTSNQIISLDYIKDLKNLKTLIIRDNNLLELDGVEELEQIEYINALYNQNLRSIAGVEDLPNLQILCVPNYKTRIINQLEKLKKINPNVEVRNI
jgi:cold shock CspA family protein